MIVFVKTASIVHTGLARIALAIHGETAAAPRVLAAAAYRIAAKLEDVAAAEGFAFSVSACKARQGIVEIQYVLGSSTGDGMDDDIAQEIAIEACADGGFYPIDCLVEMGEINPSA